MTEAQLCDLVLELTGKTEKELPRFRIIALSKIALQRLATLIATARTEPFAQALRQLARKDVTVNIVAGVGDLTAAKTAVEPILADQISTAEVYFSGITRRGQYVPDRSALSLDRTPGFPFFTVVGDQMIVRYNNTSPTATATIRGPVVRTLANIPPTLNDKFAQLVAFLATQAGASLLASMESTKAEGAEAG